MESRLGPDHPDTISTRNNLAAAYQAAGRIAQAISLHEAAHKQYETKLGPDDPHTIAARNDLALAYVGAGRYTDALPLLESNLKQSVSKLGADHPNTLISRINLATTYDHVGRNAEAIPHFEAVLVHADSKLGPDHEYTLTALNNLAVGYWATNRPEKAIPVFETLVKTLESKHGASHPTTLRVVGNLGLNYLDSGQTDKALPLLEKAYEGAKQDPALREFGNALLRGYAKAGKAQQAAAIRNELLAAARRALPGNSPELASALAPLGTSLLEISAFADAEPILRECLAIREKAIPDNWRTHHTRALLGRALLGQKKTAEAEPLLLAGYEGLKQREKAIPPRSRDYLIEAVRPLAQLYEAKGNPDEAKKWQKALEAAKAAQSAPPAKKP